MARLACGRAAPPDIGMFRHDVRRADPPHFLFRPQNEDNLHAGIRIARRRNIAEGVAVISALQNLAGSEFNPRSFDAQMTAIHIAPVAVDGVGERRRRTKGKKHSKNRGRAAHAVPPDFGGRIAPCLEKKTAPKGAARDRELADAADAADAPGNAGALGGQLESIARKARLRAAFLTVTSCPKCRVDTILQLVSHQTISYREGCI